MYPINNPKIDPLTVSFDFFKKSDVNNLFKCAEDIEYKDAKINNFFDKKNDTIKEKGKLNKDHRNCKVKVISLNKDTDWLFKKITQQIRYTNYTNYNMVLKFIEPLNFLKYTYCKNIDDGGYYKIHVDDDGLYSEHNYAMIRKLTFVIQLSNPQEYEGGKLLLYIDNKVHEAPNDFGSMIIFPSGIAHEVTPITRGTRHSLVGWITGPNIL